MAADTSHHIIGLIPSRWGSSRFPGKPLHPIAGKPLVQHVWERVCRCSRLDAIAIATDDQRIFDAAVSFGARAIMTSPDHPSGSDRLAEAVRSFPAATHIVNIQGDEPLIDPALIDRLAEALVSDEALSMATVACPISTREDLDNPNIVKVALARNGDALYFSRSVIPYARHPRVAPPLRHLGIYAHAATSKTMCAGPRPLEQTESLEQLRALENGARIRVILTDHVSVGVDTPEQAEQVEQILLNIH
ncbi:MAG: 3-deoxy-manno-octulosonate cytidylyltransferase [Akkermansia muciniphila]